MPVRTLVINQIVQESATQRFLEVRRKDQQRALELLRSDPNLRCPPSPPLPPPPPCGSPCALRISWRLQFAVCAADPSLFGST